jgi:uncharacterized MAPEG superfamily protein
VPPRQFNVVKTTQSKRSRGLDHVVASRAYSTLDMHLSSELFDLGCVALATALMWIPYTLALIRYGGLSAALGNREGALPQLPAWAGRAKRAHANAVENLVVFAPIVLTAAWAGVTTPATAAAANVYLSSRLVHYFVYCAGIPLVRTLSFVLGWGATMVIAAALFLQQLR